MPEKLVFLDAATLFPVPAEDHFAPFRAFGSVTWHPTTLPEDVISRIADATIVFTNKVVIGASEIAAAPQLKLIQITATGTNNIDLPAAKEAGINVCNVGGYSTAAVTQHVFAMLLQIFTHTSDYNKDVRKVWPASPMFTRLDYPVMELAGKTLGIAGLGSIGSSVAKAGAGFGMKIVALGRDGARPSGDIPRLPREDFFSQADVITLHCPQTPETEKLINAQTLEWMKPSAVLINTSRGGLVDEPALADALKSGQIAAAGLDVLSVEPPQADHPLLAPDVPNLYLTPHTAWTSKEARATLLRTCAENVKSFLAGNVQNQVT
ncbi:MAG: D-2-hydroxyacid dehydrogenase [Verrucomicrobiota bacterium]